MISIHIVSFIIGVIVGLIGGVVISISAEKMMFFDERYWAGWGKGYETGYEVKKDKDEEGEVR